MKTINLELSKRLAPYLENIDTEYSLYNILISNGGKGITVLNEIEKKYFIKEQGDILQKICKTLTLEEAIEFLPAFNLKKISYVDNEGLTLLISYEIFYGDYSTGQKKQVIYAIEEFLEYLLDNNLIEKGKRN